MELLDNKKLSQEDVIAQLLDLLKANDMKKEAVDVGEICLYIDGLEKKLGEMTNELTNVQHQLIEMQNDTITNHIKAYVQKSVDKVNNTYNHMVSELFLVKESVRAKATEIVGVFKTKGRTALGKVYDIFNVKEKLESIKTQVNESQAEVAHTIDKIDAFGAGMRESSHMIASTFRQAAGKTEVDYASVEKKISKTEIFKKPWIAKSKILAGMEVRLDAAIDKVNEVHSKNELNHMLKLYDNLEDRIGQQKLSIVAEDAKEYGADMFEAYKETMKQDYELDQKMKSVEVKEVSR